MENLDKPPEYLKRFMPLPQLIRIVEKGCLSLSNPAYWEDKNDCAAIQAYQRICGAGAIRALCFASGKEMVHHWFTYAGENGCCIHFNTGLLLAALDRCGSLVHRAVIYTPGNELKASTLKTMKPEDIPFIKRRPYECEREYRVVWTGAEGEVPPDIPVAGCIEYLTLSPHIRDDEAAESLGKMFETRYGTPVKRSRILEDADWVSRFDHLGQRGGNNCNER